MEGLTYEELVGLEDERQHNNIELIASENFCSDRVRNACGSILTNKYAEGYSGRRYYGGCQIIDMIESKAIEDVCKLFDCNYANVQPHCGSSANQSVYRALLNKGDTVLGMDLGAGGHLTHGHSMSFSGQDYDIVSYGVDENGILDYADLEKKLFGYNPKMVIVGASSYSQIIDYDRIFEMIQSYKLEKMLGVHEPPYYVVDMAHVAGLVAGYQHPNPCKWADVVTSTTHKTLRGPRGGIILWNDDFFTKKINSAVFPGIQGGPLEHIICAKGICFEEALQPEFKDYAKNVVHNSKVFAQRFISNGWKVVSNGTANHMFVLDVYNSVGLSGRQVEEFLDEIGITLNKNQIPNDTLSPLKSSGVRIGTPAMTTKGWEFRDFEKLADIMNDALREYANDIDENGNVPNDIWYTYKDKYRPKISELIKEVNNRVRED